MKLKPFYHLNHSDLQTVAKQKIGRVLSEQEVTRIVPLVISRINWYEAIADVISEEISQKTIAIP